MFAFVGAKYAKLRKLRGHLKQTVKDYVMQHLVATLRSTMADVLGNSKLANVSNSLLDAASAGGPEAVKQALAHKLKSEASSLLQRTPVGAAARELGLSVDEAMELAEGKLEVLTKVAETMGVYPGVLIAMFAVLRKDMDAFWSAAESIGKHPGINFDAQVLRVLVPLIRNKTDASPLKVLAMVKAVVHTFNSVTHENLDPELVSAVMSTALDPTTGIEQVAKLVGKIHPLAGQLVELFERVKNHNRALAIQRACSALGLAGVHLPGSLVKSLSGIVEGDFQQPEVAKLLGMLGVHNPLLLQVMLSLVEQNWAAVRSQAPSVIVSLAQSLHIELDESVINTLCFLAFGQHISITRPMAKLQLPAEVVDSIVELLILRGPHSARINIRRLEASTGMSNDQAMQIHRLKWVAGWLHISTEVLGGLLEMVVQEPFPQHWNALLDLTLRVVNIPLRFKDIIRAQLLVFVSNDDSSIEPALRQWLPPAQHEDIAFLSACVKFGRNLGPGVTHEGLLALKHDLPSALSAPEVNARLKAECNTGSQSTTAAHSQAATPVQVAAVQAVQRRVEVQQLVDRCLILENLVQEAVTSESGRYLPASIQNQSPDRWKSIGLSLKIARVVVSFSGERSAPEELLSTVLRCHGMQSTTHCIHAVRLHELVMLGQLADGRATIDYFAHQMNAQSSYLQNVLEIAMGHPRAEDTIRACKQLSAQALTTDQQQQLGKLLDNIFREQASIQQLAHKAQDACDRLEIPLFLMSFASEAPNAVVRAQLADYLAVQTGAAEVVVDSALTVASVIRRSLESPSSVFSDTSAWLPNVASLLNDVFPMHRGAVEEGLTVLRMVTESFSEPCAMKLINAVLASVHTKSTALHESQHDIFRQLAQLFWKLGQQQHHSRTAPSASAAHAVLGIKPSALDTPLQGQLGLPEGCIACVSALHAHDVYQLRAGLSQITTQLPAASTIPSSLLQALVSVGTGDLTTTEDDAQAIGIPVDAFEAYMLLSHRHRASELLASAALHRTLVALGLDAEKAVAVICLTCDEFDDFDQVMTGLAALVPKSVPGPIVQGLLACCVAGVTPSAQPALLRPLMVRLGLPQSPRIDSLVQIFKGNLVELQASLSVGAGMSEFSVDSIVAVASLASLHSGRDIIGKLENHTKRQVESTIARAMELDITLVQRLMTLMQAHTKGHKTELGFVTDLLLESVYGENPAGVDPTAINADLNEVAHAVLQHIVSQPTHIDSPDVVHEPLRISEAAPVDGQGGPASISGAASNLADWEASSVHSDTQQSGGPDVNGSGPEPTAVVGSIDHGLLRNPRTFTTAAIRQRQATVRRSLQEGLTTSPKDLQDIALHFLELVAVHHFKTSHPVQVEQGPRSLAVTLTDEVAGSALADYIPAVQGLFGICAGNVAPATALFERLSLTRDLGRAAVGLITRDSDLVFCDDGGLMAHILQTSVTEDTKSSLRLLLRACAGQLDVSDAKLLGAEHANDAKALRVLLQVGSQRNVVTTAQALAEVLEAEESMIEALLQWIQSCSLDDVLASTSVISHRLQLDPAATKLLCAVSGKQFSVETLSTIMKPLCARLHASARTAAAVVRIAFAAHLNQNAQARAAVTVLQHEILGSLGTSPAASALFEAAAAVAFHDQTDLRKLIRSLAESASLDVEWVDLAAQMGLRSPEMVGHILRIAQTPTAVTRAVSSLANVILGHERDVASLLTQLQVGLRTDDASPALHGMLTTAMGVEFRRPDKILEGLEACASAALPPAPAGQQRDCDTRGEIETGFTALTAEALPGKRKALPSLGHFTSLSAGQHTMAKVVGGLLQPRERISAELRSESSALRGQLRQVLSQTAAHAGGLQVGTWNTQEVTQKATAAVADAVIDLCFAHPADLMDAKFCSRLWSILSPAGDSSGSAVDRHGVISELVALLPHGTVVSTPVSLSNLRTALPMVIQELGAEEIASATEAEVLSEACVLLLQLAAGAQPNQICESVIDFVEAHADEIPGLEDVVACTRVLAQVVSSVNVGTCVDDLIDKLVHTVLPILCRKANISAETIDRVVQLVPAVLQLLHGHFNGEQLGQAFGVPADIVAGFMALSTGKHIDKVIPLANRIGSFDESKVRKAVQIATRVKAVLHSRGGNPLSALTPSSKPQTPGMDSDKLFEMVDTDHSGLLHFEQFMNALKYHSINLSRQKALEVFSKVDQDCSQTLDKDEFRKAMAAVEQDLGDNILRAIGLSPTKLFAALATQICLLALLLAFVFLGVTGFTTGGTFSSVVNSVIPAGMATTLGAKKDQAAEQVSSIGSTIKTRLSQAIKNISG